jgi:hypothetical protein
MMLVIGVLLLLDELVSFLLVVFSLVDAYFSFFFAFLFSSSSVLTSASESERSAADRLDSLRGFMGDGI